MKSIRTLIEYCSNTSDIIIRNKSHRISAMALYSSAHFPDAEYYKIALEHHTGLLIIPSANQLFFTQSIGAAEGIPDNQVGKNKVIYRNNIFHAINVNDYQFVKRIIIGTPKDIEGECSFSDYEDSRTPATMLSLAWISCTKKREDVIATQLEISETLQKRNT